MPTPAQLTALAQQYGTDDAGFKQAVNAVTQRERAAGVAQGMGAFQANPQPSRAQAQPAPTPGMSSRGRPLKPTKPYSSPAPIPRASPAPAFQPATPSTSFSRPPSSLNPNVHRMPTRIPLSTAPTPVPPLSRISDPRYQGYYSTYPARMRLGTSSLMQPNALSASGTGSNTPSAAGNKRSRTIINYAEIEGLEESEDESNDSDARGGKRMAGMVPRRALGLQGVGDKAVWGDGKSYLGVLPPGNLVIVQAARLTKHTAYSEEQLEEQAEKLAVLVPIQIDIDVDTFKIRDSFTWNLNETLITPDGFARVFCDDLDIPSSWAAEVAKQIKEQIEDQAGVAEIPVRGEDDERDNIEKDLRVILNLDVQIGTLHLVDRVEWDLSSSLTPELFASILVRDLSLSSSASPLIAHAIHEELFRLKKTCLEIGLVGEDASEQLARRRGAKQLEGVWRDWAETAHFGPRVEVLSLDEMDKVEAEKERAMRVARRNKIAGSRTGGRRR